MKQKVERWNWAIVRNNLQGTVQSEDIEVYTDADSYGNKEVIVDIKIQLTHTPEEDELQV